MRAFVEQRGEDVWLREGGLLKVAAAEAEDDAVDRSLRAARELGVEEEAIATEPGQRLDSPPFRRGVFFRDGATVQPARLALALKRAARAAGVQLFEHTPVSSVRPGSLGTRGGPVRADEIVLALNAWATGWPLGRRQTTFGSAVVLTEPVPELLEEIGWTGGEAVTDGRMFLHYFRTTPDGRVLMGSGSGRPERGGRVGAGVLDDVPAQERAHAGLRTLLPALAEARIEARWSGPIDVSADRLPRFGTLAGTRIHFGAGYSGNGVGPSWLGGQILASLALGARDEWSSLPLVDSPAAAAGAVPLSRRSWSAGARSPRRRRSALDGGRQPPPAPPRRSRGSSGCRSGRDEARRPFSSSR